MIFCRIFWLFDFPICRLFDFPKIEHCTISYASDGRIQAICQSWDALECIYCLVLYLLEFRSSWLESKSGSVDRCIRWVTLPERRSHGSMIWSHSQSKLPIGLDQIGSSVMNEAETHCSHCARTQGRCAGFYVWYLSIFLLRVSFAVLVIRIRFRYDQQASSMANVVRRIAFN